MISRRTLLTASSALVLPSAFPRAGAAGELTGNIKLTMPASGLSDQALHFIALMGVEWVTTCGPGGPTYTDEGRVVKMAGDNTEPPRKEDEIRRIKGRVESFGLKVGNSCCTIFARRSSGARERTRPSRTFASRFASGKVGIPVVEYNWYALRARGGYYKKPGRGGVQLAAHDYDRSRDRPPLPDVGEHTAAQLWSRYERFLKAVVPVAERAGVRLAVHPNDPPPPQYRGIEQILGSVDGLRRVCDTVRSPANGITFDTGVTREMGYVGGQIKATMRQL